MGRAGPKTAPNIHPGLICWCQHMECVWRVSMHIGTTTPLWIAVVEERSIQSGVCVPSGPACRQAGFATRTPKGKPLASLAGNQRHVSIDEQRSGRP